MITIKDQEYFSLDFSSEWTKIFDQASVSYLKSAQEKVFFSILDMNGYYYVKEANLNAYKEWNQKLFNDGRVSNFPESSVQVDYYYGQLPSSLLLSKVNLNFFSTVHSFFDTYAHFLHKSLFPSESIPPRLYFHDIAGKIKKEPKMVAISSVIDKFTQQYIYSYLNDIDNTGKHKEHLSPQITVWLNDGEQTIEVPSFSKGSKQHYDVYMEDALEDSCKFVIDFFQEVTAKVYDFLSI